jgi:hypothetical protein
MTHRPNSQRLGIYAIGPEGEREGLEQWRNKIDFAAKSDQAYI